MKLKFDNTGKAQADPFIFYDDGKRFHGFFRKSFKRLVILRRDP